MFRFGSFTLCVSSVVWHSFSFFLFFVQVKEIFENALNERMKQHACRGLGINIENPNSGFPTLDELDMQTIHEAYQFLTKKFVTDPKNKKSTSFLSIDQVKANQKRMMGRRNSNTSDVGDSAPMGGRRGSFSGPLSRRGSTSEGAPRSPSRSRFEITVWKFQDFSVTQILREINF